MYITKLVYSDINNFSDEDFTYLKDKSIIHDTDYGTTELLQDTVYNLYHDEDLNAYSKEEREHILELLNTNVGTEVIELLEKGELDFVLFVYD